MDILYLPIDERPCNTTIVEMIADTGSDIHLKMPPVKLLGSKKKAALTEKLWEWVGKEAANCDGLIFSPELMLYGGLIPSRLHHLNEGKRQEMLDRLTKIKQKNPDIKIVSSTIVMRTPKYNSSDEEPDYYEDYGQSIFLSKYLEDKKKRMGLSEEEERQLKKAADETPQEVIADYETRRAYNLETSFSMLGLISKGIIDFIVVPQDDSAEFGYTAIDQKKVFEFINKQKLRQQTLVYPGSDEVGASLLARLVNEQKGRQPKIFAFYSSTLGPSLIPNYEDRPFNETLKKHILAVNGRLVDSMNDADIILAYNTPGKVMQESWEQQKEVDSTYYSFRDIQTFVERIKEGLRTGKKVIVADCAYSNGGDKELLDYLFQEKVFLNLHSYKGWNTNANTLGTTLSQGCVADRLSKKTVKTNIYHLLDDYIYQAVVRMKMTETVLEDEGLNYFDLQDKAKGINHLVSEDILRVVKEDFPELTEEIEISHLASRSPWNRMFETELTFNLTIMAGEFID
ncbi:DUF4127 family protein [Alkalibacterium sp. s-m-22]